MKLIEAEFAKITPYKRGEFEKKRSCRGEAAAEEEAMMGAAAKKEVKEEQVVEVLICLLLCQDRTFQNS